MMSKMYKNGLVLLTVWLFLMTFVACGTTNTSPDYADAASFEAALNTGADLTGKTVSFTVDKIVPDSSFGYNLQAGEHLNFCSSKNPKASVGDTVTLEVTEVSSLLGSYIISYKNITVTPGKTTSNSNNDNAAQSKETVSERGSTNFESEEKSENSVNQLEITRESIDLSNIRSYYAEIAAGLLIGDLAEKNDQMTVGSDLTATLNSSLPTNAGETFTVSVGPINIQQQEDNWQTEDFTIGGLPKASILNWVKEDAGMTPNVIYTFTIADGGDIYLSQISFE